MMVLGVGKDDQTALWSILHKAFARFPGSVVIHSGMTARKTPVLTGGQIAL